MLYSALRRLKSGTSDETNGRHIISIEAAEACKETDSPNILDVGAGYGHDLKAIRELLDQKARLYAVESYPQSVEHLRSSGVEVCDVNIENAVLPFADQHFDVVICNQVLEHTKEIFWVVSELIRVTKIGGHLIVGVPNLGSLHNRVLLLFGQQPPAIHVFGPHVRGYTVPGMVDFLERGGYLKVTKVLGGNFYPLPPMLSRLLSKMLPGLSVSSFYISKRLKDGSFLSVFFSPEASELVDTLYYRG